MKRCWKIAPLPAQLHSLLGALPCRCGVAPSFLLAPNTERARQQEGLAAARRRVPWGGDKGTPDRAGTLLPGMSSVG